MSNKLVYRKRLEAHKLLFGRIFDVDTADFRKRDICGAGRRQFPAAPLRHQRSSSTSRVAQGEPEVQPDGVLDEYRGKATAAIRDIGHAKGYRRLPCPTSSLSDNTLRGHHGIPLRRGTPSRHERCLRHGTSLRLQRTCLLRACLLWTRLLPATHQPTRYGAMTCCPPTPRRV